MNKLMTQTKDALRSIPGPVTAVFVVSVISMNLLANKSIFNLPWLASTAGVFVSWISFLCMDAVCKRFGAKAATILNTFAMVVSLLVSLLFALILKIPGIWASSYAAPDQEIANIINNSLDATFSSTWYVVLGSAAAMFLGGLVNSLMNKTIGKIVDKHDTFGGFAARSFISTCAGQFVDNLTFGLFVSYVFFGWTMTQVFACGFMMMLVELLFEAVFSPVGYKLSMKWKREEVGKEYLEKYVTK